MSPSATPAGLGAPLASYFFVGPGKTGTSWLYEFIGRRRLASVPSLKEPHLVDKDAAEAARLTRTLYSCSDRMCDFSNTYSIDPDNPRRILAYNPDARVIVTSRLPSRRIVSHYAFEIRSGAEDVGVATYLDAGDPVQMVARSDYRAVLNRYLDVFAPDRVLLLPLEQLETDPQTYVDRLTEFLDVERVELTAEDLAPVRTRAQPRSRLAARAAARGGQWLRRRGSARTLGILKRSRLISRALYRPAHPGRDLPDFGSASDRIATLDDEYRELVLEHAGYRLSPET